MTVTKKGLLGLCNILGISKVSSKSKEQLKALIKEYQDSTDIKILNSGKKIRYIYHIADLHIRALERHNEYKCVFENLIETIRSKGNLQESVLVICGDIFHNRDRLVSECILLFNDFIERVSKLVDIVLILGNHDTFTHGDRLDTITGITDIKTYNNFYFLKNSGVYKYHNIDFVVSSLLDNKFIRRSEIPDTDNITIALYHGPVTGCKLDNNTTLPNSPGNFKVSDFKGYDYALLGDIHKRQYLTDTIAYPGSLIQQNHKEEPEHGTLLWDLKEKTSEFIKIPNDYGYISILLKDTILENLNTIKFPKKSRVKLYHPYTENFIAEDIKKIISQKTEIISFTKEIENTTNDTEIDNTETQDLGYSRQKLDNIIFANIIKEHPVKIQEKLKNIHRKYLANEISEITIDTITNTLSIDSISFMNMFIYGGDHINKINFKDLKGVTGVLASNASGKSSLFNVILYSLYGYIFKSRASSNRNIINKNSKNFYVKVVISTDKNIKYIIERTGKSRNKKNTNGVIVSTMEESVVFIKIQDNITTNLTDSTKNDTTLKIHKILGLPSRESFLLTNVLSYTTYASLLTMSNTEISHTFAELFNLDCYSNIYSKVLKKVKKLGEDIKFKEGEYSSLKKKIDKICNENKIKEVFETKEKFVTSIKNLNDKIQYIIEEEINLGNISVIEIPKNLKKTREELVKSNEKFVEQNIENLDELEKEKYALESQIKTSSKNIINEQEYNKLQNNEKFIIKDFIDDYKSYNNVNRYSDYVSIPKDLYDDTLELFTYIETSDYLDNTTKIVEYNMNIQLQKDNKTIEKKIKVINEKIKEIISYNKSLDIYNSNISKIKDIDNFLSIENEILKKNELLLLKKQYIQQKNEDKIKLENTNKLITELEYILKDKETLVNETTILLEEINTLKEEENILKLYKGITSDKNLPRLILQDTIKKIEIDANMMIYKLLGLYVVLSNDEDNTITIKKNNIILGTEQISGYEKFVVNIGLKIALDKYKHYSGINFFCIDEALDCISNDNIDKVDDIFGFLKNHYSSIFVVSHNEELKNKINSRIVIDTDFSCSRIH